MLEPRKVRVIRCNKHLAIEVPANWHPPRQVTTYFFREEQDRREIVLRVDSPANEEPSALKRMESTFAESFPMLVVILVTYSLAAVNEHYPRILHTKPERLVEYFLTWLLIVEVIRFLWIILNKAVAALPNSPVVKAVAQLIVIVNHTSVNIPFKLGVILGRLLMGSENHEEVVSHKLDFPYERVEARLRAAGSSSGQIETVLRIIRDSMAE